jgi:hypothetical protein
MKKVRILAVITAIAVGLTVAYQWQNAPQSSEETVSLAEKGFVKNPAAGSKATTNKGRVEYFERLLKDPELGKIPDGIRQKELSFLSAMKVNAPMKAKALDDAFSWKEVGPFDVGGRTRAIGIDSRNKNIIVVGAASGGIWKSIDGGTSWSMKSDLGQTLGVSDLVQDPTNLDRWFYTTGEFTGSADSRDRSASYYGSGIYISEDNGDNWTKIETTRDDDVGFSSQYDFISSIAVSPTTGTIFFTSNAFGVFRSTNGLQNNSYVLGSVNNHIFANVAVNDDGVVIAVLSRGFGGVPQESDPGVYISRNDGISWTKISPGAFPNNPSRSVIGVSPSNPDIFYVFTDTGTGATGLRLFKFDISDLNNIIATDRTDGIPNFGGDVGDLNPQGGYNLMVKVLPNNPDVVFLGATNLFRSTNGFSTEPPKDGDGFTLPGETPKYWIGGYDRDNDISQYPDHHPDQHNLVFDPTNPLRAFSTHDGGISVTEDITETPVVWSDTDNGYNVTQFYTVSIHPDAEDPRIAGGTQDNGTPYFLFDLNAQSGNSEDASSGDGSFTYIGRNYALTSAQNGFLLKFGYSGVSLVDFSYTAPLQAGNQLFIHPFAVNPTDENYLFYPDGNHLWRNKTMLTNPRNTSNSSGTIQGWTELNNVNVGTDGHEISALSFSTANPANRLYFGGSTDDERPVIKRLDNPDAATGAVDISIPAAAVGAYVHDIAVNPEDGDEAIVVLSNYNILSMWHTKNAGVSWNSVGGANSTNGGLEGLDAPSIRTVAFAPTENEGTFVFAGTSVGLFATDQLNGSNTEWVQVAESTVGNAVVAELDYRISDDLLAVGTHGRGIFIGQIGMSTSTEEPVFSESPASFTLEQNFPNPFNPTTNISFELPVNSTVSLTIYDISGREIASVYSNQNLTSGAHTATFDAGNLASGTYIYRLEAVPVNGGSLFSRTRSMTLIK